MSSVNPTGAEPRPQVARATEPEKTSAPAAAPAQAQPAAGGEDLFDGIQKIASSAIGKVSHWFERLIDRPFAMGRDGFVALDPSGKVIGGSPPSAEVRDIHAPKSPLDPLLKILADGDEADIAFSLPGGRTVKARTDGAGFKELPLDELAKSPLGAGLDPKKGGLVDLQVSTPKGEGDEARVLALPKDYDGPLFVVDIDQTLRDTKVEAFASGKPQPPIAGAKELLEQVAARGVPIVYLSAGMERLRPANEQFLDQLPKGILLDRSSLNVADVLPVNGIQARRQGLYKAAVMADLKSTFPGAKLFGLGDDNYGDAMAYTQLGATAYIHDVRPGDENLPADFHGTVTKEYTPDFIAKVGADLQRAIETSASFGGTPVPVDETKDISQHLDQITGTRATDGNRIEALVDGVNAF